MNYTISPEFTPIIDTIETHLVGKRETIALSLATFFAGGHLLLEDIPMTSRWWISGLLDPQAQFEAQSLILDDEALHEIGHGQFCAADQQQEADDQQ